MNRLPVVPRAAAIIERATPEALVALPDGARARYNALIRRLVSFERALACASFG